MRRMLIVGCGGSGGKTLRYLMDQLRADLKAGDAGDTIPAVWQFLHIDAPLTEEVEPAGLRTVTQHNEGIHQVGAYCSVGSNASFATVQRSVLDRLSQSARDAVAGATGGNVLRDNASWQPRDDAEQAAANRIPLSEGAGQVRMIGRTLTLNSMDKVLAAIRAARGRIFTDEAELQARRVASAMPTLGDLSNAHDDEVITFVVGSMAGGSGASMLLDVCRVMTAAGLDPKLRGVFAYSPEVFQGIAEAGRSGMNGNTLAMFSEMVALQTALSDGAGGIGEAAKRDAATLTALRVETAKGQAQSFARVLPIGSSMGPQGFAAVHGADANSVFRRVGRGLARLVGSTGALVDYTAYVLGNPVGAPTGDQFYLGWGTEWSPLTWAGFGYASLSMGRDRYREYAAQRLARGAVDRLLGGHMDPASNQTSSEQLEERLLHEKDGFLAACGLPVLGTSALEGDHVVDRSATAWLEGLAENFVSDTTAAAAADVLAQYPGHDHGDSLQDIDMWMNEALAGYQQRRARLEPVERRLTVLVHEKVRDVVQELDAKVQDEIRDALGRRGLAYAGGLVEQLCGSNGRGGRLQTLAGALREAAQATRCDLAEVPQDVQDLVTRLGGGRRGRNQRIAQSGAQLATRVRHGVEEELRRWLYRTLAGSLSDVLVDLCLNVLAPLRSGLRDAYVSLERESKDRSVVSGVALYGTDRYLQWPDEQDVPARFAEAHNEVVITDSKSFPAQFKIDVVRSVPDDRSYRDARSEVLGAVVTGEWEDVAGAAAPRDVLVRTRSWVPQALPDAFGAGMGPRAAQFDIRVRARNVLATALAFVDRSGESFELFVKQGVKGYLEDETVSEDERVARSQQVVAKFMSTLRMAEPMIAVDDQMVRNLHGGRDVLRNYLMSDIPFAQLPAGRDVLDRLAADSSVAPQTKSAFAKQVQATHNDASTRVDVFGTYENYAPIVFRSVFKPIADEWGGLNDAGRYNFFRWRRTRSLPGFVPMGDVERRTMVLGWWIGQALGLISLPPRDTIAPAKVWDLDNDEWLTFPWPMLTPPERFKDSRIRDEWLPAVLESLPVAWLKLYSSTGLMTHQENPLRAYQALRAIADASEIDPLPGVASNGLRLIRTWLVDGSSASGQPTRVPGSPEPGLTGAAVEQRAEALKDMAAKLRERYESRYVTPGKGVGGLTDTRRVAHVTPAADLADDCVAALKTLEQLSDQALADVLESFTVAASGPGYGADTVDEIDL